MIHALLAFLLVLPFAVVLLGIGIFLRLRVLALWRNGEASPYMVDSVSQSALAPSSRAVYCKDADGRTPRLLCVFIPRRLGEIKPGDLIWVIHPTQTLDRGVAAAAYL